MARVLTVDDSRAVRSVIVRHLKEWGVEVDEAEDGLKGLEKLAEASYDLILLDVTMPEMDGPTMLHKLRESGNRTPVLMLTSESKKSIIVDAMKAGIEDYILKPFKPDEFRAKISKVIKLDGDAAQPVGSAERPAVDVLLVDDMESVHGKLRSLLPEAVSLDTASDAHTALQRAREKTYRVVVVDNVMPNTDSVSLMGQIRAVQRRATVVSLCLRSADNAAAEAKRDGYDGVLYKPLTAELVGELMDRHLATGEVAVFEGNAVRVVEYAGRDEGLPRYYGRLAERMKSELPKVAEACFESVEIDAAKLPIHADYTLALLNDIRKATQKLGIAMRVRGHADLGELMGKFAETAEITFEAA